MNTIIKGVILLALGSIGNASETPPVQDNTALSKQSCEEKNYLFSEGECLETYISRGSDRQKVIVILPGRNGADGNPMTWMPAIADALTSQSKITSYLINYPGYGKSTSENFQRLGAKALNPGNKDYLKMIEDVLQQIKKREKAEELYLFAHSMGTTIAGNLIGEYPGLITKLATYGGLFDIDKWYGNKATENYKGIQPFQVADKIQGTSLLLLVGSDDKVALPTYSKSYDKQLKNNGISSSLTIIDGYGHGMNDKNISADIVEKVTIFYLKD